MPPQTDLIVSEGFEERSVGVLESLACNRIAVPKVIIGRYREENGPNTRYRDRFEQASKVVAGHPGDPVMHDNDGQWIQQALQKTESNRVIIDITALSNRALFPALDIAAVSGREILITYSEAGEYWPKESAWKLLGQELEHGRTLPQIVDEKPWLFGSEHRVELVPFHDGYDSAGCGLALIAFLPYKRARLAAVLGEEDYADFLFIAGRPRLPRNSWRLDAVKQINQDIIADRRLIDMDTFGYRNVLEKLSILLFSAGSILEKYDLHLAILGSKLQNVGCWAMSCMVPCLTMLTSVPLKYHSDAFSEGIGRTWIFPLTSTTR
jgi:hypothetical protein